MNEKIRKMVIAALFAAIICVTTVVIQIPSPVNGYINMGDCFILLSGWVLGPVYGPIASAIGAAFADIVSGYIIYAPSTFLIKALVSFSAYFIFRLMRPLFKKRDAIARTISATAGEALMILGYFGYEALILGFGIAAAPNIPGNLIQGAFGIVTSVLIYEFILKNEKFKDWISGLKKQY